MRTGYTWMALALCGAACGGDETSITVAGTIEIREVNLAPLVDGRLARLVADEGDSVRTGDTVAVLTQPGLEERIAEAIARHRSAVAHVRDLAAGARRQELERARAGLESALADSARAALDASRITRLYDSTAASAADRDAAAAAATTSAARARQAREDLALLEAGPREQTLLAARRDAEAARAYIASLTALRDELTLTAPQPGVILLRLAEVGEVIGAGTPVLTLGVVGDPWIRAFVGQDVIGRVRRGTDVRIAIDSYPDTTFAGVIAEIDPDAAFIPRAALTERERADLVFGIKVRIDDAQGRLKPGMPVDLIIPLAT